VVVTVREGTSLNRLNVDRFDFVCVHDVAQDFHGDRWLGQLEIARTRAFCALSQLRPRPKESKL
jgi:D-threo-aldose 1-dehydrogenase